MPCCHLEGDYQGSVTQIGPRVLTFSFDATAPVPIRLSNCPTCPTSKTFVFGEGGGKPKPLVHGWYILQADVDLFVAQVNPDDACATNPLATGVKVSAGGSFCFYVSGAVNDGIIVLQYCLQAAPTPCAATTEGGVQDAFNVEGIARVNRLNTVRTMADTGETADLAPALASLKCGGPPGPQAP